MSVFAVIQNDTNLCDNVIVLDEGSTWSPPENHYIVNIDNGEGGINWTYDPATGVWTPPPPPESVVDPVAP